MSKKCSLIDLIEEFLASLVGRSVSTKKLYRNVLKHFAEFKWKDPKILEVQEIHKFLLHLEEEHAYKKNTMRTYTNIIRSFLKFLEREDLRTKIKGIRPPKTLPRVPTAEEIEKMIEAAGTLRNKLIIQILARTGLRVGELCNLNNQDIDLENLRLIVRGRGEWSPKGEKERLVRMDSETADLIQKYVGSRKKGLLIDVTSSTIRSIVKGVAKKADVRSAERITPHKLRHFFACDFLQRGGDVRSLQKLLGHGELSTTEIYLDYTFEMVSDAYDRVFGEKNKKESVGIRKLEGNCE